MLFVGALTVALFVILFGVYISMSIFKEPNNGGHRPTTQAPQSDPAYGAGPSAGAAAPNPYANSLPAYANSLQNASIYQSLAQAEAQMKMAMMQQMYASQAMVFPPPPPPPLKKLETVMTLGEIIGWRVWRIDALGQLQSGYKATVWAPGIPMTGDPKTNHGVHAFKELGDRVHNAAAEYKSPHGMALGRVALWGEVIEHEHGYRAEFAKIVAIDSVVGVPLAENAAVLARLRQAYCSAPGRKTVEGGEAA